MAGIDMTRLVGSASVKTSSAKTAGTSDTSKEASKTDFASMIQGKANEAAEDGQESSTSVKSQQDSAGDKPVEKQEERPVGQKKDKAADAVQEEKDPSGAMAELQAALGQMLVQAVEEDVKEPVQQSGQLVQAEQIEQLEQVVQVVQNPQMTEQIPTSGEEEQNEAVSQMGELALTTAPGEAEPVQNAGAEDVLAFGTKVQAAGAGSREKTPEAVRTEEVHTGKEQEIQSDANASRVPEVKTSEDSERGAAGSQENRTGESDTANEGVMASPMTDTAGTREVFTPMEAAGEKSSVLKTTPQTFGTDLGNRLASSLPKSNGTLTIELEPASLGRMTIRVVYEAGKAAVSIMSANPRTVELLSQNAGEIARILEEKTGQTTMVYTPDSRQPYDEGQAGQEQQRQNHQDRQEHRKQEQTEAFTQMLRLGLV